MPGKFSKSGNEWGLEEISAEEEILAGRGGSPGRPGRRPWAAGEAAAGRLGGRLGGSGEASWRGRILLPGASVGGDHASCAKWPETEPKSVFSIGRRPAPPGRLLGATLLPDGCPVGVRRQVWTGRGG